jgi:hypothetical protein
MIHIVYMVMYLKMQFIVFLSVHFIKMIELLCLTVLIILFPSLYNISSLDITKLVKNWILYCSNQCIHLFDILVDLIINYPQLGYCINTIISFIPPFFSLYCLLLNNKTIFNMYTYIVVYDIILLSLLIIIDIICTLAVIWFIWFMLLMYLYGEGLVRCKNLFPNQVYRYWQ